MKRIIVRRFKKILWVCLGALVPSILVLVSCQATQGPKPTGTLVFNADHVYLPAHCASSFTFQAGGGTAPYTYTVTSGSGTVGSSSGTFIAGDAGTATVTATDSMGITGTTSVTGYWSLTNDAIKAVAQDSNGNTYLGGTFTRACPTLAPNAIFVNASATPDYTINLGSGFDGAINSGVQLSDGSIVVGGNFTHYKGTAIAHLAKISAAGVLDATFSSGAGPDAAVNSIVKDSSGGIYVAGAFTHFNGSAANQYLVKLTSAGAVDASFTAGGPNDVVTQIAIDSTASSLYLVGSFTQYAGTGVVDLAKVSPSTGALDSTFNTGVGSGPNAAPLAVVADSSGGVYVGGAFTSFNGTSVLQVVKLISASGLIDGTFTSALPASGETTALAVDSTGLYAAGTFTNGIAKLQLTGAVDSGFSVGAGLAGGAPSTTVATLSLDGSGNLYAGGDFATYAGVTVGGVAQLSTTNGSLNGAFATGLGVVGSGTQLGSVAQIISLTGGDVLILGQFTGYQGLTANHIAELDSNFDVDTTFLAGDGFDPGVADATVNTLAVDTSNDIFVGGTFAQYRGVTVNGLTKINSSGGLVGAFASAVQTPAQVTALALDGASNLYIGGPFTKYNGTATDAMTRVSATTGTLDSTYNTNLGGGSYLLNQSPTVITADSTNNIYVGGTGFSVGPLGKVDITGTPVAAFNSGGAWFTAGDTVNSISFDTSSNTYVGGSFDKFNGVNVHNVVKMSSAGVIDSTFTPSVGFNDVVLSLTSFFAGSLYVAGDFSTYQAASVGTLVKLNSSTAAAVSAFDSNASFSLVPGSTVSLVAPASSTKLFVITSGGAAAYTASGVTSYFQNIIVIDSSTGAAAE